jgi:hypothetical protein
MKSSTQYIVPVLSSSDIKRDLIWYEKYMGFIYGFGDDSYCGLIRDNFEFHLQFHYGNDEDPINASVMKLFVNDIEPYIAEFLDRGTITEKQIHRQTDWGTDEFGFFDLNRNAFFVVMDL